MAIGSLIGLAILGLSMSVAPLSSAGISPSKAIVQRTYNVTHSNSYADLNTSYQVTDKSPLVQDTDGNYIYYDESGTFGKQSKWISYTSNSEIQQIQYNCFYLTHVSGGITSYLQYNSITNALQYNPTSPTIGNDESYCFVIKEQLTDVNGIESIDQEDTKDVYIYNLQAQSYLHSDISFSLTEPTLFRIYGSTTRITPANNNDYSLTLNGGLLKFWKLTTFSQILKITLVGDHQESITKTVDYFSKTTSSSTIGSGDIVALVGKRDSKNSLFTIGSLQSAHNREAIVINSYDPSNVGFSSDMAIGMAKFRLEFNQALDAYVLFDFERNGGTGGYLSAGNRESENRLLTIDEPDETAIWDFEWDESNKITCRNPNIDKYIGLNATMINSDLNYLFSSYQKSTLDTFGTSLYLHVWSTIEKTISSNIALIRTAETTTHGYEGTIKPLYYYYPTGSTNQIYEPLDLTPEEINAWINTDKIRINASPILRSIELMHEPTKRVLRDDYELVRFTRHPYYANELINFIYDENIMNVQFDDEYWRYDEYSQLAVYGLQNGVSTLTIRGESGIAETTMTINVCDITNIEIETMPKTNFTVGDSFTSNGLQIRVYYSDSTSEVISEGYNISSEPNMTTVGNKTVRVYYKTGYVEYQIHVSNLAPTSVTLHGPDNDLNIDDTFQLTWEFSPQSSSESVTFESSDPSVLSVDSNGLLTAHSAGSANITITSQSNLTDTINVNVLEMDSFSISEHSITLEVGKTKTIQYELHTTKSNVTITGTSNNASVASVNNFVISANSIGYTTIIFTTNIGLSDVCMVSVISPSEEPGDNPSGDEGEGEETPQEGEDGKPDDEEPSDEGEGHSGEPDSGEGNTPDKGSDTTPDSENKEQKNMTVGVVAGVVAISIVGGTVGTVVGVRIHKKKKAKKS